MSLTGKSGQQAGAENVLKVEGWIKERKRLRDWDEYKANGRLNRTTISQELDISRSVTTQNKKVRSILEAADKLWFGADSVAKDAQEACIERANISLGKVSGENSKLMTRVAELEAENRQLRSELDAFKRMQNMIASGEAGFQL